MSNRETFLANARGARDHKLELSDIDMLKSIESAASFAAFATARANWVTYRQALRDYPSTFPDPCTEDDIPEMPLSPDEQAALDATTE
jgi:hypothetical protein